MLTAGEYDDGRLDWDAFRLAPTGSSLGADADIGAAASLVREGLPAPVALPRHAGAAFLAVRGCDR